MTSVEQVDTKRSRNLLEFNIKHNFNNVSYANNIVLMEDKERNPNELLNNKA